MEKAGKKKQRGMLHSFLPDFQGLFYAQNLGHCKQSASIKIFVIPGFMTAQHRSFSSDPIALIFSLLCHMVIKCFLPLPCASLELTLLLVFYNLQMNVLLVKDVLD